VMSGAVHVIAASSPDRMPSDEPFAHLIMRRLVSLYEIAVGVSPTPLATFDGRS
jgi:hypothetical protein